MSARAVEANSGVGDDNRSDRDVWLNRARCPDPKKRPDTELGQLLDSDRGGRPADSGAADDHREPREQPTVRRVLTLRREGDRLIQQGSDTSDSARIPWHDGERRPCDQVAGEPEMEDLRHVVTVSDEGPAPISVSPWRAFQEKP